MKQSLKDKTKARIVIYAKFAVRRVQQKVERLRSKNQLENYRQTDSMEYHRTKDGIRKLLTVVEVWWVLGKVLVLLMKSDVILTPGVMFSLACQIAQVRLLC